MAFGFFKNMKGTKQIRIMVTDNKNEHLLRKNNNKKINIDAEVNR